MTATEFAEKVNTAYPTVAKWLRDGKVPGAFRQKIGNMEIWMIPGDVLKDFERPKMGRPPLTDEERAARAAGKSGSGLPFEPPAPKPAKLMRGATRKARPKKTAKKKGGAAK